MEYIYKNSVNLEKEGLYLNRLEQIENKDNEILFKIANYYYDLYLKDKVK